MTVEEIIRAAPSVACHPVRRHVLSLTDWQAMAEALGAAPEVALRGLWADRGQVHVLLDAEGMLLPASVEVENGFYPALSPWRAEAILFERAIRDLAGFSAAGGVDARPREDHGRWGLTTPLAARPGAAAEPMEAGGRTGFGPVSGGLGGAYRLEFGRSGGRIAGAELRGGYAHRGILALLRGKSPRAAARFAARVAGGATVAHATAFAAAAEAASGTEIPARAAGLRAVMAGLERMIGALSGLRAVADAAGAGLLAETCCTVLDTGMTAAGVAFGHRLMMDCVVPGGVAGDMTDEGAAAILEAAGRVLAAEPAVRALMAATLMPRLRDLPAAVGLVARRLDAAVTAAADLPGLLDGLVEGMLSEALPIGSGEGIGATEGPEGTVWHWLRLEGGQIGGGFMVDPAWAAWPRFERALEGVDAAEAGLMAAAFGIAAAGIDL